MPISDNIKTARERRGLSAPQLARQADISISALWHYERGNVVPPRPKLARIAAALLMDPDELESGSPQQASGLISVQFPETLRPAATALLALLRSLGVTATPRETLDDTRVLIKI
jgi:transcriptional regulator with XRE-family HTH domain